MDNKYKISYIREYELYEFGYVLQPGNQYTFPKDIHIMSWMR